MCVLGCAGVEAEVELPFAGLHQLIRPILSRLDALPEIQAGALRGALALGPAAGEHRLVVAVAVLSLLAEAAAERPVLCLLDDAHRLDDASAETLSFVARRLGPERVGFLFAAREGDARDFEAHDLPVLRLGGTASGRGRRVARSPRRAAPSRTCASSSSRPPRATRSR